MTLRLGSCSGYSGIKNDLGDQKINNGQDKHLIFSYNFFSTLDLNSHLPKPVPEAKDDKEAAKDEKEGDKEKEPEDKDIEKEKV